MSSTTKYPTGLIPLLFVEMWERFSYYGMRAILVLFLVSEVAAGGMGLTKTDAVAIYGLYTAGVYIFSLPGGWIADRFWGTKKAIVVGGSIIMLGHILLAVSSNIKWVFFFGLLCVALGTGLLKPNISTLVGKLYDKNEVEGRDAGFSLFYMGINLGSILGGLIVGYLGEKVNWHLGFGVAAIAMLIGLVNFIYINRRSLGGKGEQVQLAAAQSLPSSKGVTGLVSLLFLGLVAVLAMTGYIDLMTAKGLAGAMGIIIVGIAIAFFLNIYLGGNLNHNEKKRMIVLAVLFFGAALFWSGFEQAGSSLTLFARDMTDRNIGGFEVPAAWFQKLNPLFVIILTPFIAQFWLRQKAKNRHTSVFTKFGVALVLMGLGYWVLVPAANTGITGVKVSAMFLLVTYFIHTTAELLLSPVGLSTFSRLAPERFTSQLMGFWFVAAALGNLLAGLLAASMDKSATGVPSVFTQTFITSVVFGVVMLLIAKPLTRWALEDERK